MAILLISYTIYNDTAFAIASVMSQLYILELRPGTLEISLYALAATVSGAIGSLAFFWIRPLISFRLEYWLLVCYVIMILIPAWGIIGFAGVNFGFKVSRLYAWEPLTTMIVCSVLTWITTFPREMGVLRLTVLSLRLRHYHHHLLPSPLLRNGPAKERSPLVRSTMGSFMCNSKCPEFYYQFGQSPDKKSRNTALGELRRERTAPKRHPQSPLPARAQSHLHGDRVRH